MRKIISLILIVLSSIGMAQIIGGPVSPGVLTNSYVPYLNAIKSPSLGAYNIYANNFIAPTQTIVSAGGTTSLTVSSQEQIIVTGNQLQNVQLPDATTLQNGFKFFINNNTTNKTITLLYNDGSTYTTIVQGAAAYVYCTYIGSTNGTWDIHFLLPSNAVWGTSGASFTGTVNITNSVSAASYSASGTSTLTGLQNNGNLISSGISTLTGNAYFGGTVNIGPGSYSYNPGAVLSVVNATNYVVTSVQTRTNTGFSEVFQGANTATASTANFFTGSNTSTSSTVPFFLPNTAYEETYAAQRIWALGSSTGYMAWLTGGELSTNERMRITNDGKIGINNASPSKTLDVIGNANISSTTTVNGLINSSTLTIGNTNTLTGGNSGTIAVLSDAVFPVTLWGTSFNPLNATTYYFGVNGYATTNLATTVGQITLPYNCTLVSWDLNAITAGVQGTNETTTLSINGTTNYTLTTSMTYSNATLVDNKSATGLSQNFNSGDVLNIKMVCPTWATKPTSVYQGLVLWFVRRQ